MSLPIEWMSPLTVAKTTRPSLESLVLRQMRLHLRDGDLHRLGGDHELRQEHLSPAERVAKPLDGRREHLADDLLRRPACRDDRLDELRSRIRVTALDSRRQRSVSGAAEARGSSARSSAGGEVVDWRSAAGDDEGARRGLSEDGGTPCSDASRAASSSCDQAIHAAACSSLPSSTSAAFTARATSRSPGFTIAASRPLAARHREERGVEGGASRQTVADVAHAKHRRQTPLLRDDAHRLQRDATLLADRSQPSWSASRRPDRSRRAHDRGRQREHARRSQDALPVSPGYPRRRVPSTTTAAPYAPASGSIESMDSGEPLTELISARPG